MNDDFHRTNLNLHRSDYEFLLARYGFGWTTQVRDLIHQRVEELRSQSETKTKTHSFTQTEWRKLNQGLEIVCQLPEPTIDLDKLIREQEQ